MMKPIDPNDLPAAWPKRELEWARELGRIRLGVEPVPDQVAKYRRVTWAITAVAGWIGGFIAILFVAFRAPITGLIVGGLLAGPIIAGAWLGYARMARRAAQYLRERAEALGGPVGSAIADHPGTGRPQPGQAEDGRQ